MKPEFNPELDGVRGLLAVCVFLFHCAPRTGNAWVDGFLGSLWPAMDVFFALSGFLITRNLLDDIDNRHRFRNFYANRALRIIPAYAMLMFLVFAVLPLSRAGAEEVEKLPDVWWYATFSFNAKVALLNGWPDGPLLNHFWSVCVEEQFYIIWPLVIYLFRGRALALMIGAFFLVSVLAEIYFYVRNAHWAVTHTNLLTRLDSLGIGALLALLHRSRWQFTYIRWFTLIFYASGVVILYSALARSGLRLNGLYSHLILQPTLMIWSAALVYLLANARERHPWIGALFRARISVFLGKYSYGIYLYHWPLYVMLVPAGMFGWATGNAWLSFAFVAVLTLLAALASYQGLERWFLRLKLRGYEPRAPADSPVQEKAADLRPTA